RGHEQRNGGDRDTERVDASAEGDCSHQIQQEEQAGDREDAHAPAFSQTNAGSQRPETRRGAVGDGEAVEGVQDEDDECGDAVQISEPEQGTGPEPERGDGLGGQTWKRQDPSQVDLFAPGDRQADRVPGQGDHAREKESGEIENEGAHRLASDRGSLGGSRNARYVPSVAAAETANARGRARTPATPARNSSPMPIPKV